MAWTVPTALFFCAIATLLVVFTWLDVRSPSQRRCGVFGIATTRGDRLFLGLLGGAFLLVAWLAIADDGALPGALIALAWLAATLRWG